MELGTRLAETRPTGIRIGIGLQRHAGGGVHYDTRGFFGLNVPLLNAPCSRVLDYKMRVGSPKAFIST